MRHRSANVVRAKEKSENGDLKNKINVQTSHGLPCVIVILIIAFGTYISHTSNQSRQGSLQLNDQNLLRSKSFDFENSFGSGKRLTPCPEAFKKKFWMESSKINQPIARAIRMQGWEKTDNFEEAQVIWTYVSTTRLYDKLKPWQRYNHIPKYKLWNQKDSFVTYMMEYAEKSGKELSAIPETYRLDTASDLKKFKYRLFKGGGLSVPWVLKKPNVNQGKGITMLGPNTEELKNVLKRVENDKGEQNYIIQQYVCNEMTINKRKFDFRIFWIVASLDPLIVLIHDGYLRIGNSDYTEGDFSNTKAHLTTHTGLASEGKLGGIQ
jgi:Tubulin-tyrosine ligase family